MRKIRPLIKDCVGHLPAQVPANNVVQATPETRSHCSPEAYAHTLFYSCKVLSQQQHRILHVTLIWMKIHLRGGPTFIVQQMESFYTEQSNVDPVGNVLLLLQGEQGQVLKGSSSSVLRQMERRQGCITATWPGVQSHICICGWAAVYS